MEKTCHIIVKGRVQGVGFRYFTKGEADRLGIKGWVKNLDDGSVECVCTGDEKNINAFLESVKKGPRFAKVTEMTVEETDAGERFNAFEIRL
jgi:acylphosphatase